MAEILFLIGLTFAAILALLAIGSWVFAALGIVGLGLIVFFGNPSFLKGLGALQFNTVDSFTFVSLPMFIFMGELIRFSGASGRLFRGATPWVARLPGGLLHTNIAASAVFSACSGSSMATAATIGRVAIPELERRNYNRSMMLGSLAAGGTLGILIPPSLGLIVYGVFVGESIGRLFMAGLLPGILMTALFMVYIAVSSLARPGISPNLSRPTLSDLLASIRDIAPVGILVLSVLGTIYLGVATPSEAAALGATMALLICAFYGRLSIEVIQKAGLSAVATTAWLLIIIIAAKILGTALAYLEVPSDLAKGIAALDINVFVVLATIAVMYIVLGMFMEGTSMLLLSLPVVYPLVTEMGVDGIWFGIFVIITIEIGQLTPPVGVNLYVMHAITGKKYFDDIVRGVIPFIAIMVLMLFLLVVFPSIALWLPDTMFDLR